MVDNQENENIVTETRQSMWSQMGKTEDWWAIWLAGILFIIATACVFIWKPPVEELPEYRSIMEQEMEEAGFRTIAYTEAENKLKGIKASKEGFTKTLIGITDRPKGWTTNPITSIYLSESEAASRRAEAADRYEQAQAELERTRARAEQAENAAREANFEDPELNRKAREAITEWRQASSALSSAKSAANTQPYNLIPSLIILGVLLMLFFAIGGRYIGFNLKEYFIGFPIIYLLTILSYLLSKQATLSALGISYVLFGIFLGLIIANTTGVAKSVKTAGQTEFFIKTGLVLLGARILFGQIALIGIPGLFVTWVVTPIVLITTYWFGQNIIKIPSKELNITVSSDMCVSGVSAAIATASACRAKKEELTLAIGMSMIFVAIMIFVLPTIANVTGMHPVWAGAWLGGTVDNTGSVVAAGELIGYEAMVVAATIKMIQNIMIGVIAFGVAAYWCLRVEPERACKPGETPIKLSFGGALSEIWYRFPKFILGFIGASIIFSIMQAGVSMDWGNAMVSDGILSVANRFRGWFFALAFVSIGLSISYQDLKEPLRGGKPVILYIVGQSFNLLLTLFVAWLMFMVIFSDITEKLMLGA
ncbi:MAG: putative sulfate exporter family transporter [Desulfosalsimonadaceae bacterium]